MATVAQTLAVNAAFLQEIKDDNQQLRDATCSAEILLRQPCSGRCELHRWTDALSELRDQLAMHFALEDAYGYFEDAVTQAPQLCDQAEVLRSQHVDLFMEICRLADWADQLLHEKPSPKRSRQLAEAFLMFLHRFRVHERQENDLIVAAFDDDIGVGD